MEKVLSNEARDIKDEFLAGFVEDVTAVPESSAP
jgi:hypothetical protein